MPQKALTNDFSIGLAKPEDMANLSGIEVVEAMGTGRLPMPPMASVLPIRPYRWTEGDVEFRATPEARFSNPMGVVHGGWTMTMLDTAMAVAAHSTLKRGEIYTSLETSVKFIRPITEETGELHVFGHVISRGKTIIILDGRMENKEGKLFAHGTSSCQVMPIPVRKAQ